MVGMVLMVLYGWLLTFAPSRSRGDLSTRGWRRSDEPAKIAAGLRNNAVRS